MQSLIPRQRVDQHRPAYGFSRSQKGAQQWHTAQKCEKAKANAYSGEQPPIPTKKTSHRDLNAADSDSKKMTCYSPITGYRSRHPSPNGGFGITFNKQKSNGQKIEVSCGQCIGCRLDKSREWAIRCVHEAQMHEDNCFITLTYNEENLPSDGSLVKEHFQKFMKKLRKKADHKIRYYQCGEYGQNLQRPHYHACLFGHDFEDKTHFSDNNGNTLHTSQLLDDTWAKGFATIGQMTFESAAYCARYAMKKITGEAAHAHYQNVNKTTGEITQLQSEYTTMSRRPGLGQTWYNKYQTDLFPEDECVIDGRIMKPPRYYAKIYQQQEPEQYEQMKQHRKRFFEDHKKDATWQRLQQRETVKKAQLGQLNRSIENET